MALMIAGDPAHPQAYELPSPRWHAPDTDTLAGMGRKVRVEPVALATPSRGSPSLAPAIQHSVPGKPVARGYPKRCFDLSRVPTRLPVPKPAN
jgi:hypothetical protein